MSQRGLDPCPSDEALRAKYDAQQAQGHAHGPVVRREPAPKRKPKPQPMQPNVDVVVFHALLHQAKIPPPVPEFRFDLHRQWRVDYAFLEGKVALEVEGGIWQNGRHNRGSGFLKDMAKYNKLAVMGWRLLRCTPSTLADPATVALIREALTPQQDAR